MERINHLVVPTNNQAEFILDGNALDTNPGTKRDGTPTNISYVNTERGYAKQIASFNGSSSRIQISNTNTSRVNYDNDFGISVIIYLIGSGNVENIFSGHGTRDVVITKNADNRVRLSFWDGSNSYSALSDQPLPTGRWYHIVGERSKTNGLKLYINNALDGENSFTGNGNNLSSGNYHDALGWGPTNTGRYFTGYIGHFRIRNSIYTPEEREQFYQEFLKELGPSIGQTHRPNNNNFPLYSLRHLEVGKVLEISKPKVGSNYINQVDGSSYTASNVSDSSNGLYNVMGFNGSNSDINCGTSVGNFNNQDFTIGASIYNNSNDGIERVIMARYEYSTNKRQWYLGKFTDGFYDFRVGTGASGNISQVRSPNVAITQKWQRIIGTYTNSNKTLRLYIDGVKVGEVIGLYGVTAQTQTTGIGRLFNTPVTAFWNGSIVKPIIISRALSDREILEDYYAHKII